MFELLFVLASLYVLSVGLNYAFMANDVIREGLKLRYLFFSLPLAIFWPFMGYWLSSVIHEEKNERIKYWQDK